MPLIEALLRATGVPVIGHAGYEAEDIIATLAGKIDGMVEVYSGDRDLFAIVRHPDRVVLYPEKGGPATITEAEVERRYGIPGRRYADYAVLRGDPSDGLPGLRGVGDRQAAALVRKWGGVKEILAGAELSDAARDYLERASRVVMPVTDAPVEVPDVSLPLAPPDPATVERMSRELGIESSAARLVNALAAN
jgi:5'-3' exonuclease